MHVTLVTEIRRACSSLNVPRVTERLVSRQSPLARRLTAHGLNGEPPAAAPRDRSPRYCGALKHYLIAHTVQIFSCQRDELRRGDMIHLYIQLGQWPPDSRVTCDVRLYSWLAGTRRFVHVLY